MFIIFIDKLFLKKRYNYCVIKILIIDIGFEESPIFFRENLGPMFNFSNFIN